MFGLIGHSTSFEQARLKARSLGYDEYADGDLDMWCAAPPQLVERVTVTSPTGQEIQGAYIDSVFVPEMLRRFKTAKRKVLKAMELAQNKDISAFVNEEYGLVAGHAHLVLWGGARLPVDDDDLLAVLRWNISHCNQWQNTRVLLSPKTERTDLSIK